MPKDIMFKNFTGDANLNNRKQQFQRSTGKIVIGRSVSSQIKERIHKNFPGGFSPSDPLSLCWTLKFLLNPMPSFTNRIYSIFLNLRVHGNSLTIQLPSGAC